MHTWVTKDIKYQNTSSVQVDIKILLHTNKYKIKWCNNNHWFEDCSWSCDRHGHVTETVSMKMFLVNVLVSSCSIDEV